MKKSKLWMATGAIVIALGGVLVGRANSKFSTPSSLYYRTAGVGSTCKLLGSISVSANRLTTTASTVQAKISTSSTGVQKPLFAASNCSSPVYLIPTN